MSNKAGTLLWNRVQIINLPAGNSIYDTGLQQQNTSFDNSSTNEPPLGIPGLAPPPDGTTPGTRCQVIPMPPTWPDTLDIGEPYLDTSTNTIMVPFKNFGAAIPRLNVLFWVPHTLASPGLATPYSALTGTTGATGTTGFTGTTIG